MQKLSYKNEFDLHENGLSRVTSIVVEQGCFRTELRIAGKQLLIYFRKVTSRIYSTKFFTLNQSVNLLTADEGLALETSALESLYGG